MTRSHSSAFNWHVAGLSIVAFILLLLSTLSVPLIKSIYLIRAEATQTTGSLSDARFDLGIFGVCGSGLRVNTGGPSFTSVEACSRSELGYTLYSGNVNRRVLVGSGLTKALVFVPLATGFTGLTGVFAIIAGFVGSLGWWTILSLAISTLFSWISLGLATGVIGLTRAGLGGQGDRVDTILVGTSIGATMPLILVSAILLSIAFILQILGLFRQRRANRYTDHPSHRVDLAQSHSRGSEATYTNNSSPNGVGQAENGFRQKVAQ